MLSTTGRGNGSTGREVALIGAITLALVGAVALNLSPYLRGPDSWRWAYAIPGVPWRQVVPVITLVAYGCALSLAWRRLPGGEGPRRRAHLVGLLAFTALSTPLIQAALLFTESPDVLIPVFYRTISAGASGSFTVAAQISDLPTFVQRYPDLMPTFPVHPQRYPPGIPMLFYLARRAYAQLPELADLVGAHLRLYQCHDLDLMRLSNAAIASASLQMALPIISGLTVFPLYALTRAVWNRRAALVATGFYPLVPSFALWSARWDQLYPLLTCATVYLFYIGLTRQRRAWLAASGFVLGIATFFSLGMLAMLMPLGLIALAWVIPHRERHRWRRLAIDAGIFTLGMALPWGAYQAASGHGIVEIWQVSMGYHLGLDRGYWEWLAYHPYDFLLFLGLPLALLFLLDVLRSVSHYRESRAILPLAFGLTLLLLSLSGVARGEVARVWLFLTPFPVAIAAGRIESGQHHSGKVRAILWLLGVQLLLFNAFLRVVTTGVTPPPARVPAPERIESATTVSAEFGQEIALLGYDADDDRGQALGITLYWQALSPIAQSYTVFNHLIAPDGSLAAQSDGVPQHGLAPTTCWRPGEIIADRHTLFLPDNLNGPYTLLTGLYILETGERLPITDRGASPDHAVRLLVADLEPHEP